MKSCSFQCLCVVVEKQSSDFLVEDFYLGCSKAKTMKRKYVNFGAIVVLTFSVEYF